MNYFMCISNKKNLHFACEIVCNTEKLTTAQEEMAAGEHGITRWKYEMEL